MSGAGSKAARGRTPPRSVTPTQPTRGQGGAESDTDYEIREFLEGLLEGFRAAAAANAAQGDTGPRQPKWFETDGNRGGNWSDLNELEKTLPKFSGSVEAYRENLKSPGGLSRTASPGRGGASPYGDGAATPKGGGFASDPLSTMMRRHALRAFLEELCGSVAKAFEQMATLAVKNSLGSQGGIGLPDQRMKYKFSPMEFQKTLANMGYGVGAGADWWRALFRSLDIDEDGAVSLQDMYDALVLDLPPLPGGQAPDKGSVFFSSSQDATRTLSPTSRQHVFSPSSRGSPLASSVSPRHGVFDDECRMCGSVLGKMTLFCDTCGTAR